MTRRHDRPCARCGKTHPGQVACDREDLEHLADFREDSNITAYIIYAHGSDLQKWAEKHGPEYLAARERLRRILRQMREADHGKGIDEEDEGK